MSIKITVNDVDAELDQSKFFGEILLPEKWLEDDVFSPEEMFLCQLNLSEVYESVGKTMLPESGMLYFFIDYQKNPQAVVRYFDGEADAYTMFNEDWEGDYDVYTEWPMEFSLQASDKDTAMLIKDENVGEGEVALLRYVSNSLDVDFLSDSECVMYFMISEKDLREGNFSKVYLKTVNLD